MQLRYPNPNPNPDPGPNPNPEPNPEPNPGPNQVPWGIAPCRAYLDVCADGGLLNFMYFGLKPPM